MVPTVTVTGTVPVPAGLAAVMVVGLTTTTSLAGVDPKSTVGVPVNPLPVIVTEVPPAAGPLCGSMPVTVGPDEGAMSGPDAAHCESPTVMTAPDSRPLSHV